MTYGLRLRIIPSLLSFHFAGFSFALEEATMKPMRFTGPPRASTKRGKKPKISFPLADASGECISTHASSTNSAMNTHTQIPQTREK